MKCPFCDGRDIRIYTDRENNLVWYLCWECRYQGYNALLFNDNIDSGAALQFQTNRDNRIAEDKI